MTTFTSMTDFLTNATEGDTYAEQRKQGSRALSTYRMVRRLTPEDSQQATRGTGGLVETLTTQHIGRSEIAGRPEYTYLSTLSTNETYAYDTFVSTVIGYGREGRNEVVSNQPSPRMSAKVLRREHATAVNLMFGSEADLSNVAA